MTGTQILECKFGMLAVKKGFATKKQINRALEDQKRLRAEGKHLFLSEILIQAKVISEKQRDALLESNQELREKLAKIVNAEENKKKESLNGVKKRELKTK